MKKNHKHIKRAYIVFDGLKKTVDVRSLFECRGRWFFTFKTYLWFIADYETGMLIGKNQTLFDEAEAIEICKKLVPKFSPQAMIILQSSEKVNNWSQLEEKSYWEPI